MDAEQILAGDNHEEFLQNFVELLENHIREHRLRIKSITVKGEKTTALDKITISREFFWSPDIYNRVFNFMLDMAESDFLELETSMQQDSTWDEE